MNWQQWMNERIAARDRKVPTNTLSGVDEMRRQQASTPMTLADLYNMAAGAGAGIAGAPADTANMMMGLSRLKQGLPPQMAFEPLNETPMSSDWIGERMGADVESGPFIAGSIGVPGVDDLAPMMAKAGKLVGGAFSDPNALLGMTLFHGSPHKFDKFQLDKIGTGEGAQVNGHGLYFAENPKVAGEYPKDSGYLYEVDIPDEAIDKMLDLDKPAHEQPEVVQRALLEAGVIDSSSIDPALVQKRIKAFGQAKGEGGASIYARLEDKLGSKKAASEFLNSLGIPGIRYLDGTSRNAGDGTRNFVVFDENLIKPLTRNGQPIGAASDAFRFPDELTATKGEPVRAVNELRKTKPSKPITVYHSTNADFTEFDPSQGIGGQMWFTSSKDKAAKGYDGAQAGRLVEAEIDIRNPAGWDEYEKLGTDEMLARGYDGVALEEDGETVYIALFPEQIRVKSNKPVK